MYSMGRDSYACDLCGVELPWDGSDECQGDMWECEVCGTHFCTKCFVDRLGRKRFDNMLRGGDKVLCPECFQKEEQRD